MIHNLKIWPVFFIAVINGKKLFEIRQMDRDFRVGDFILLREFTAATSSYTGREAMVRISYIYASNDYLKDGYGVVAIRLVDDDTESIIENIENPSEMVNILAEHTRSLAASVRSDMNFRLHLKNKLEKMVRLSDEPKFREELLKFINVLQMREMGDYEEVSKRDLS